MKDQAIAKINKMGRIGRVITNIMRVVVIIGLVCSVVGLIVTLVIPKEFIVFKIGGVGSIEVDLDAIHESLSDREREQIESGEALKELNFSLTTESSTVHFDQVSVEGNKIVFSGSGNDLRTFNLRNLVHVMLAATLTVIVTLISVIFMGRLCRAVELCVTPFEENVIQKLRAFAYSLIPWVLLKSVSDSWFSSALSGKLNITFSIDISMLAVVLMLLALVYIFQYGAVLQQESDETL